MCKDIRTLLSSFILTCDHHIGYLFNHYCRRSIMGNFHFFKILLNPASFLLSSSLLTCTNVPATCCSIHSAAWGTNMIRFPFEPFLPLPSIPHQSLLLPPSLHLHPHLPPLLMHTNVRTRPGKIRNKRKATWRWSNLNRVRDSCEKVPTARLWEWESRN